MLVKFLWISAYFRGSCFCFHRLFVFKEWDKSISYFCPTFFSFFKYSIRSCSTLKFKIIA
ncbi:hypothetical protein EUZ95_03185 [Enterococcus durans]|uniref:Uncharacterized protein n=1 Tax=Enterococcus durans TaxID=53345 RepID=A0AB36S923_9ENTE|nr:hypothetical protein CRM96_10585 [Enterococcus durans]QCJ63524.1 hypothetical protein C9423_03820 [Lactobacillus sp. Koumiss]RXE81685.1 hypothetical protein EIA52_01155 [Enterococcus durans]RYT09719.1 hypothetical protein EAI85_04645 [Enterococcus durans]TBX34790.1 hypothetical protein EUZ95_03185 [Enterococcus durans]